jgi:hypothetical protein
MADLPIRPMIRHRPRKFGMLRPAGGRLGMRRSVPGRSENGAFRSLLSPNVGLILIFDCQQGSAEHTHQNLQMSPSFWSTQWQVMQHFSAMVLMSELFWLLTGN